MLRAPYLVLPGTLADHGVESLDLDTDEVAEREPLLEAPMAGARWFPRDAHLRPDRLVGELVARVREAGGIVEEGRPVTAIGEGEVETQQGTERAATIVVATGAVAPKLLRPLGLRIPIQPGKGYSITTTRPDRCPSVPLLFAEASMVVTPWQSGMRLGGTMEFAGYDDRLNPTRIEALRKGARRYLREVGGGEGESWCGWRPMTPDELPILDQVRPGLVLAIGHGMMGVSMAPATGELVAALVTGDEPLVDPGPFCLARLGR